MGAIEVGKPAPPFTLVDQRGDNVSLEGFRGRRLVVYFYPRADTPGCTAQSCALRDALPELRDLDAAVVGISPDEPEAQRRFDEKYGLGFTLLSDPGHEVAERYEAWGERSLYGRTFEGIIRSAFVIDEEGRVVAAFPKISPKDTVPSVKAALEGIAAPG